MTKEEMKEWIDNASYEELLEKWRFAPIGDPFFKDEMGDYYSQVMNRKRSEITPKEHTRVSKNIGWRV